MRARIVMNVQLVIVFEAAEVGEAGGVVEQNAQSEPCGARVAFEVGVAVEVAERFSEVLLDRLVEIQSRRAGRGA